MMETKGLPILYQRPSLKRPLIETEALDDNHILNLLNWSKPSREFIVHLKTRISKILYKMTKHPDSAPFLKPFDHHKYPDYRIKIPELLDLTLIQHRIQSCSYYITEAIFKADIERLIHNWEVYSGGPNTEISQRAQRLRE
eukprot:NODE_8989_length_629_cov_30.088933_g8361_i0.p1 GENE.NODE_8989_length_629_cov_30.088933_g8361_i0~~NODE_8989_length_629_cov_30.088933_g8361_i0.p1  ORF type:complete len:159 (+),score=20.24 NODE_8989_length_629_cov_30.088933_g8361_i0:57-479(+)